MKPSWLLLRSATLALAFVHLFPARKHVALFFAAPSLGEAWKGFGALLAVALYLLPPRTQANLLCAAWSRARPLLVALGWLLAAAHLAPALDHLPRFLADPSWPHAWRGLGASLAAVWFVLPIELQAGLLGRAVTLLTTVGVGDFLKAGTVKFIDQTGSHHSSHLRR